MEVVCISAEVTLLVEGITSGIDGDELDVPFLFHRISVVAFAQQGANTKLCKLSSRQSSHEPSLK